ncbi:MAG: hypothetical protein MMC33_002343 [Icmadophila ericetorum]|nr:hypothetical protein [Icmadophila ericetorum]
MLFLLTITSTFLSTALTTGATSVLVPLYIYPNDSTGNRLPLTNKINAHQGNLTYEAVINPNSGPGGNYPNSGYITSIQNLTANYNLWVIGYIPTGYGNRTLKVIEADIVSYAAWGKHAPVGIFFDEVDNGMVAGSTKIITNAVASASKQGFQYPFTLKIDNIPVPSVQDAYLGAADHLVVFEQAYGNYGAQTNAIKNFVDAGDATTDQISILVHDMPSAAQDKNLALMELTAKFTGERYGSVYLTIFSLRCWGG